MATHNFLVDLQKPNPFGATVSLFNQNSVTKTLSANARLGVCRALCVLYCVTCKAGGTFGTLLGRGDDPADKAKRQQLQKALGEYAAKLQFEVNIDPQAQDIFSGVRSWLVADIKKQNGQLQLMQSQCGKLKWPCAKEIGIKTKLNKNFYFILWLPDHVICTRNVDGISAHLFDPNYGDAKCPVDNFPSLCETFLGRPDQKDFYALKDGVEIYYYAFV